jgi:hypothetical protein
MGMYVHYYFAVLLIMSGAVILHERHSRSELLKPAVAYSAIAILCSPLLWLIPADLSHQAGPAYSSQTRFGLGALVYTYVSLVTGYTIGPSLRELHTMKIAEAFAAFAPWLTVMAAPIAILGYNAWRVLDRRAFERLILLMAAPVAVTGILGLLVGIGYNVRYVVWVIVPTMIFLAAGSARWHRWPVAASIAIILGLFGVAIANRRLSERYQNEDIRALSAYVRSQPESEMPIFVLSGYMASPVRYYLGPERPIYALPASTRNGTEVSQALEVILSRVKPGKKYWLVYSRAFHGDPHGAIRKALEQRDSLRETARFAGVVLYCGLTASRFPGLHPHPGPGNLPPRS